MKVESCVCLTALTDLPDQCKTASSTPDLVWSDIKKLKIVTPGHTCLKCE